MAPKTAMGRSPKEQEELDNSLLTLMCTFLMGRIVTDHELAETKKLLDEGADPNAESATMRLRPSTTIGEDGKILTTIATPIVMAAQVNSARLLNLLIERGADLTRIAGTSFVYGTAVTKPILLKATPTKSLKEAISTLQKHNNPKTAWPAIEEVTRRKEEVCKGLRHASEGPEI
jgi:hypothetical protein